MIQLTSVVKRRLLGVCILRTPGSATRRSTPAVPSPGTPANSWKLTGRPTYQERPSVKLINPFILAPSNEVLRRKLRPPSLNDWNRADCATIQSSLFNPREYRACVG